MTFGLINLGDVPIIPAKPERSRDNIRACRQQHPRRRAMPICIGGDHSLPIPIGQALSKHVGPEKKFGYIHFDAHIDCQPDFYGEPYTNWSHMARMVELPNIDPKNMAVVGVRGVRILPSSGVSSSRTASASIACAISIAAVSKRSLRMPWPR